VRPAHAVSALLIHGMDDTISPIGGGYSRHRGPNGELRGRTLSLDETAEYWRTADRCPPGPGETHTTEFSIRHTSDSGVVWNARSFMDRVRRRPHLAGLARRAGARGPKHPGV
jgi:poly(3-hydroxybutyrate) depolymerase